MSIKKFSKAEKDNFAREKKEGLHGWFSRRGGGGQKGWVSCQDLAKTTKKEQSLVVDQKMLLKELNKDADLPVLRVKRIKGERVHDLESNSQKGHELLCM